MTIAPEKGLLMGICEKDLDNIYSSRFKTNPSKYKSHIATRRNH